MVGVARPMSPDKPIEELDTKNWYSYLMEQNAKMWLTGWSGLKGTLFRGVPVDKFDKTELIIIINLMAKRMRELEESNIASHRPSHWTY